MDANPAVRWRLVVPGITLAVLLRLVVADQWGLLADEAYHWRWSKHLAWGYFDQPPLVAWVLAAASAVFGDAPLALRAIPILASVSGVVALLPWARDRGLWLVWGLTLPPLWILGQLAVPDALLLGAWGTALALALRGGRGWWGAGVLGGLAGLAKPTGWLLIPLCIAAADRRERRQPHPWIALGIAVLIVAPNLLWNASHDWIMIRFQVGEGLAHPGAPGWIGPLQQLGGQALFVTPFAFAAGWAWWSRPPWRLGRTDRLVWAASAPLALGFAVAAVGGPPEAHWPAPAWLAVGVGLANTTGFRSRLAWIGAWCGAIVTTVILVHARWPLVPLADDPAIRLSRGRVLAEEIGRWALPMGVAPRQPGSASGVVVYTERYQEAAWIMYYTGLAARVLPGCGRPDQEDLWRVPLASELAFFVRPSRSGPPQCAEAMFGQVSALSRIGGFDEAGRALGTWDLFEVAP